MSADPMSDKLFMALASLANEVWVLKDRQRIVETVLGEQGIDIRDAVDRYQPDDALAAELDQERSRFIDQVMRSFAQDHG